MDVLVSLLETSGFAYVLLAFLLVEAIGLFALWQVRRKGLPPAQVVSFLGAGTAFAIALLIVASDGSALLLAIALGAAFAFHLLDIKLRWKQGD